MAPKRVSFIGLGEMGAFMAKNLVKKGFELTVYDVAEKPVKELKALGAKSAATCKEAAETSDVTIIMIRDDPQITQASHWNNLTFDYSFISLCSSGSMT